MLLAIQVRMDSPALWVPQELPVQLDHPEREGQPVRMDSTDSLVCQDGRERRDL